MVPDSEKQRAREIADAILNGRTGILEGVRALLPLVHSGAIRGKRDGNLIIGVDSETGHLPIGEVRKYWAPDALVEKDLQIAAAQAQWRDLVLDACKRIATGDTA